MEPRKLLQALMDRAEENSHSLAVKLRGRPGQPQIHKFLSGVAKEPRRATLEPLAKHYDIPVEAFYSEEIAAEVADQLGLAAPTPDPAPGQAPPPPPAALSAVHRQLIKDLEDLPPAKASKFIDMIHQAAEDAREAADHLAARRKTPVTAAARKSTGKHVATISWGDGNQRQASLPLATVRDPFTAAPSERESALYRRIAKASKEPKGSAAEPPRARAAKKK
jgi:hypothetical protein